MQSYDDPLGNTTPSTSKNDSEDFETRNDSEDLERTYTESQICDYPQIFNLELSEFFPAAAAHASDLHALTNNWQSPTWEFTRLCRSHPELQHMTVQEVTNTIPWNQLDFDEEDIISFELEWNKVRFIPGVPPLNWAAEMAERKPLSTHRGLRSYDRFISIAGWLQTLVGHDAAILLPCERLGEILGCTSRQVSNLRRLGVQDGFLEIIEAHVPKHKATRFKFVKTCGVLQEYEG